MRNNYAISSHGLAAALVNRFLDWQQRMHTVNTLAGLDDHLLKDIGVSRADVEFNLSRPFWKI